MSRSPVKIQTSFLEYELSKEKLNQRFNGGFISFFIAYKLGQ